MTWKGMGCMGLHGNASDDMGWHGIGWQGIASNGIGWREWR